MSVERLCNCSKKRESVRPWSNTCEDFGDLESSRPLPGGDHWQFQDVGLYREAVVRLSLGMVAATASGNRCLDEGIRATYCDADLKILFRIVMQCQIIDDVLDYSKDLSAGLPSFLTASEIAPAGI